MLAFKKVNAANDRGDEIHSSQSPAVRPDPASIAFARASVVGHGEGLGLIAPPRDLTETPR